MTLNELAQKIYQELHADVVWEDYTLSVDCEIMCATISKAMTQATEILNDGKPKPAPYRGLLEASIEAMIALSVDFTLLGLTLMLEE